ncbi:MAG: hypothetical protein OEU36_12605 [Gammaproteobacteria bacterium]|nr:hypothetical protein [Gammaproteobacteria bacterium]
MPGSRRSFITLVVGLAAVGGAVVAIQLFVNARWHRMAYDLENQYGVHIEFDNFEFPLPWRAQGAVAKPSLAMFRPGVLNSLAVDLSHYPPEFLREHVSTIYVFRHLSIAGQPYGGATDTGKSAIYIHQDWLGDVGAYRDAMGLHHELSSLLLQSPQATALRQRWDGINPEGFSYRFGVSSWRNIAAGATDLIGSPSSYEVGFLCGYGQTSWEDDINTYAQYLIAKPRLSERLADKYPRVGAKLNMLRDFYRDMGYVSRMKSRDASAMPGNIRLSKYF